MLISALQRCSKSIPNLKLILASTSPRRKEILSSNLQLPIPLEVIGSTFDETSIDKTQFSKPHDFVIYNAQSKTKQVLEKLLALKQQYSNYLLVGADTVVVQHETIIEKPNNEAHAKEILQNLSNSQHIVLTGIQCYIVLHGSIKGEFHFVAETKVKFIELSSEMIEDYIETKEPMDKAGAYGIQGLGAPFIERIDGCYFNVVGFPLSQFCQALSTWISQHESLFSQ